MYSREETVNFLLNQSNTMALVSNVGGPKKQNCLHLAAARTTKSLVYKNKYSTSLDFPVSWHWLDRPFDTRYILIIF